MHLRLPTVRSSLEHCTSKKVRQSPCRANVSEAGNDLQFLGPQSDGATENAGVENAIRAKMQGSKIEKWKYAGVDCRDGKCRSGKIKKSRSQGVENGNWIFSSDSFPCIINPAFFPLLHFSVPPARHQLKMQDHKHEASAYHGVPVYLPANTRTKLYCLVTEEYTHD